MKELKAFSSDTLIKVYDVRIMMERILRNKYPVVWKHNERTESFSSDTLIKVYDVRIMMERILRNKYPVVWKHNERTESFFI